MKKILIVDYDERIRQLLLEELGDEGFHVSIASNGKEAEDALQESELKARAIFDHTFQFIGLMNIEGTLVEANKTALEFCGITESDAIGKPFWETPWWTHSPELQKKLRSAIKKSAKGELVRFEATHTTADGNLRYVDFSLKPVTDKRGEIVYLIPEGRDITDRKMMEEELKNHRDHLETLVKERTAELTRANEHLKEEIAERKRVESALLESEENYRSHFSLTSDVMYVVDSKFKVMSVSPSVENTLGYKPEELIGRPFQDLGVLEPQYLKKAAADTMHILDGKKFSTSVYRFITRDGKRLYGEVSGVPLMRYGRIEGVICVARDISRRMLAEEDLKRHRDHLEELVSERTAELTSVNEQLSREIMKQTQTEGFLNERQARLDSIIRSAPIGIGIVANRFLLEVNERFCDMTGYSREELIGKSSRMIYVTQKEFEFVGIDKSRQIKERGVGYMETRWKRKDGSIIDILLSSTPIITGKPSSGVLFTALDITDRKHSEKQLLESQKMLRLVLDTIPVGVFWKDLDLNYLGCNRQFAQEAGLASTDAIAGMNDFAMSWAGHADQYRSYDRTVIETGVPGLNYEHLEKRSDGSTAWLRSSKIPLQDISGKTKGVLGINEDITEQKKTEQDLQQNQEYFRAITENLPGVVFQFYARKNGEKGLYYVSEHSAEILGLDNDPKNFFELIVSRCDPEDKEALLASIDEAVRSVSRWEFETSYVKPTGEKMYVRGISLPAEYEDEIIFSGVLLDVTEQRIAGKAIITAHKQLENIIEFLPDATFIMDKDKCIIAWNRAMEELTGVSKEHVLGKDHSCSTIPFYGEPRPYLMDLLEKDDDEIASKYDFVKKRGASIFAEIFAPELNNGKGAYVWAVASPLYDSDGTIIGAIESIRDISDHKQAVESLRQSEGKYRALTEKMNDIIWTTDMNFRVTYDSPSVEKVLGFTPEERMRQNAIDMMTPESYARTLETLSRELELDKEDGADSNRAVTLELEYYHKDGTTRWLECIASAIRDKTGKPIGIHGVSRCIHDRKKAEEALKESHQHIERQMLFSKAMLSAVPIPVFFKDTMGRYLGCNQAFSEMVGMTLDHIRGKTVHEIWPDELAQVYQDRDLELIQNPRLHVYEWKVRDKDNNTRDVILSKDVFRNENGDIAGIVGAYIDITDRKKVEEELKKHRDKLEEMIKERTVDLTKAYEQLKQENEVRKTTETVLRAQEIELEQNQLSLKETNIALRVLLQKRDEDKATLEETIMTNIKTAVFPFIEKLKNSGLREGQNAYLSEIELHLREIASTYIKKLSSDHISLSPCEIQVANLIKEGKSSKEISELLNVSLNTVLTHRFCIRKKTGLKGKKINLISYLQTLT